MGHLPEKLVSSKLQVIHGEDATWKLIRIIKVELFILKLDIGMQKLLKNVQRTILVGEIQGNKELSILL
jgi:hypothetical protein